MSAPSFDNPNAVAAPLGAYSHAATVKAGSDMLWIAGQVGVRPDGALPPALNEQADEAFANVVRILTANGMTVANLVKVNVYVVSGEPADVVRAARVKHFGDARPASTFVYIPQLVEPKYLVEVEAVAAR